MMMMMITYTLSARWGFVMQGANRNSGYKQLAEEPTSSSGHKISEEEIFAPDQSTLS